ncbi:MAG TPA: T9SS type A sorting domain-containing protein [Chitinophagales bacterium]|nr:T9SS type A sorting domain-containing protein [Chitinophagales bacterium]
MKNFLLLIGLSLLGHAVSAQQTARHPNLPTAHHFLEKTQTSQRIPPRKPIAGKPANTRGVDAIPLGTSGNAFTAIRSESHCVAANNDLNTVIFIHRNDETQYGLTNAQYRYALSTDGGNSFTTNLGPLTPSATNDIDSFNARYPQVTIYNPAGNTDPANAWASYIGAWHAGSTTNDTWQGLVSGVVKLNNSTATITEHYDLINNGNVIIPTSLVQGKPGEFWATDLEYTGFSNDSLFLLYRGEMVGNDVMWTVDTMLNPGWLTSNDSTFFSTMLVAFDPSGRYGYIASTAHVLSTATTFSPYYYMTSDSGATWQGPNIINLDVATPNVTQSINSFDPADIPFVMDMDLVVDKNGHPHFGVLVTVAGSSPGTYVLDRPFNIFDITSSDGGVNWSAVRVDTVYSYNFNFGTTADPLYQATRLQLSTTQDGSRVLYTWADTDPAMGTENFLPDLKVTGLNVDNGQWSFVYNMTKGTPEEGNATLHLTSPISLYSGGVTKIPVVTTTGLDGSNNGTSPVPHRYLKGVEINDADYVFNAPNGIAKPFGQSAASLKVWPNPASNLVTVTGLNGAKAEITIVNVLGKTVQSHSSNGSDLFRFDASTLPPGLYTVHAMGNGVNSTRTFVVQR